MPRRRLPLFILLTGLGCTALAALALWQAVSGWELERVARSAERVQAAVQDRVNTQAGLLEAGAGLFAGSGGAGGRVSREDFARFVGRLDLARRYPGVQGIAYADAAPAGERAALDSRVRTVWALDLPGRGLWTHPGVPADATAEHATAILYIEPREPRNLVAVGLDMFAEPVRREAMRRARDTGEPAVTSRVQLVQEIEGPPQPGVLMYVPVYEGGAVPGTPEQRRTLLRGFVYSPLRMGDFLGAALEQSGSTAGGIDVQDEGPPAGASAGQEPLFHRGGRPPAGRTRTGVVSVGGRSWTLLLWPEGEVAARAGASAAALPWLTLGAGTALSLLLWRLSLAQARAREAAEAATRAAGAERERFETTLGSIGDGVIAADARGRVTFMNAVAERLTGRTAASCVGRPVEEVFPIVHERTRAPVENPLARALREGVTVGPANHTVLLRPDRTEIAIEDSGAPIRLPGDAEGGVAGAVLVFRDVSERRAEDERVRTQARVLESMAEGVSLSDARGVIEYTNPAEDRMFGYGPGELVGKHVSALNDLPPEENERTVAGVIERLSADGLWEGEWRNRRKDGSVFYTRARITRLDLDDGPHFVCVQEDVTGEKADAERIRVLNAELRARVAELELLLDVLPVGVFIGHDAGCGHVTANAAGARMLGLEAGRNPSKTGPGAASLPFRVFREGVELDPSELPMQRAARTGEAISGETLDVVRPDGATVHLYEYASPLRDESGAVRGCVGVFVDMTDVQRAAAAVRHSEEQLRLVIDHLPVLVSYVGADRCYHMANRHYETYLGLPRTAIIGRSVEDVLGPDAYATVRDRLDAALAGERQAFSAHIRYQGGRDKDVEVVYVPHESGGRVLGCIALVHDVSEIQEARRTLEAHGEQLERIIAERTADLERSHQRLRHAERLASLGTLAAGIGHDLGNLLLPMRVRLDSMRQKAPVELGEDIAAVEKGAEYLAQLSQGLRLLARDPTEAAPGAERTGLADWWAQVEGLLKNALPRGVTLRHELHAAPRPLRIGAAGLTQAVFNLVQNAGDAMRARGHGTVTVWAVHTPPGSDLIQIGVTDDGPGMTPEVVQRCLEPFFTTKARGLSTGMGLSLVSGVVRRAGGTVEVRSTPGQGATFVLTIPLAVDEPPGKAGAGLRAAVSLADPRTAAFVRTVAQEIGMHVETVTPSGGPPTALVWVADATVSREAAEAFLHASPERRLIRVGSVGAAGPGEAGSEEAERTGREWRIPGGLRPLALRRAIGEAAAEIGAGAPGPDAGGLGTGGFGRGSKA